MRVLMLGWEFPPFIAGGLGTACHGLTKAMSRAGTRVTFVLPKVIDRSQSSHVDLLAPAGAGHLSDQRQDSSAPAGLMTTSAGQTIEIQTGLLHRTGRTRSLAIQRGGAGLENVEFIGIPSGLGNPYRSESEGSPAERISGSQLGQTDVASAESGAKAVAPAGLDAISPAAVRRMESIIPGSDYSGDLMSEVARFAQFCTEAALQLRFDVIHAHDWMTYPAGLMIARLTGKPLVMHVHSTEFDRSGVHVNQRVYDIERRGLHGAMRVVAVSQLTKNVIVSRYGVPDNKVEVVYNGVDIEPTQGEHMTGIQSRDKIVLYFGRITYQKGPEYFIAAAKRVLDVLPDVKFVVAGSGDQAKGMIEMAARLGIGHKVLFTGFLRGRDIQRVFALADLYVMPSVSEPFGIAPLEAMVHNVPVIISKSSGVSEVLSHALKVDFWDTDDMANKIIAVLRHPPLQRTLQEHGAFEVRRLTWDGAAKRCDAVYRDVIAEMSRRRVAMG